MTVVARLGHHLRQHAVAYVALTVVLTAAPAYAASVGASDIARNAVLSKHIKNGNVKATDIAGGAVGAAALGADSVSSSRIQDGTVTGADVAESTLGKVPAAAQVDTVTTGRVTLVEGNESGPVVAKRGDWVVTAYCSDDPGAFPRGSLRLAFVHADDDTTATVRTVDGGTFNLASGGGPGSSAEVLGSTASLTGGPFFAISDSGGVQGLVSLRVPSHVGAYSGPPACEFEVALFG